MSNFGFYVDTPIHKNEEKNLFNIPLLLNEKKFTFSINQINQNKAKFNLLYKENNNNIEYQNIIYLQNFGNMNKYFRMFDNINDLLNDLISVFKENRFEIQNYTDNLIIINIKLYSRYDNIFTLNLNRVEKDDKDYNKEYIKRLLNEFQKNMEMKDQKIKDLEDKISYIYNNNEVFKKNIKEELKRKYEQIKEELNKKDEQINYINEVLMSLNSYKESILKKLEKKEEQIQNLKNSLSKVMISVNSNKEENNINKSQKMSIIENILKNSSILLDKEEIDLLLSYIPDKYTLNLLYNSKYDKNNEEKLINSYIEKNDIIILLKTDKLQRFGAYAHECFEKYKFKKRDDKAFLFNLNKKIIVKSKGNENTILRDSNSLDSITFGIGEDLKIFHNYCKKQNITHQGDYDYDYKEDKDPISGDETFKISSLEIYQAI